MVRRFLTFLPVCALALFWPAAAAGAFYCGNRIVSEGDHASEVLALCGEPAYVDQWLEYESRSRRWVTPPPGVELEDRSVVTIRVQVWVYNFGRNRLQRELRFENGRLRDIDTLGYGR